MKPKHHPDGATLMSFSAGTLPAALAAAVAAHLSLCARCRRELRLFDALGAAAMRELPEASLDRAAPDPSAVPMAAPAAAQPPAGESEVPYPLRAVIGPSLDQLSWTSLAPGLQQHRIVMPGPGDGILRLIKAAPHRPIPEHGHDGMELTLVLRGAYSDSLGRFGRGDMADLDDSVEHVPIADATEGCICLVASENEPRFRGLIPRLIQPLTR